MTKLLEKARVYIAANGGHAVVAASLGVSTAHSVEVCLGVRPPSKLFAVGMSALLGCTVPIFMQEDSDYQFLSRRRALA